MSAIRLSIIYFILWAATPVYAAPAPAMLDTIALYHLHWNGISLGYLLFDVKEKNSTYLTRINIESAGLASVFRQHKSTSTAKGYRQDTRYLPARYETDYARGKKQPRKVLLKYDRKGILEYEFISPAENPATRPRVTQQDKYGSYDPISFFLALRTAIFSSTEAAHSLLLYDGRRLMDVTIEVKQKPEKIALANQSYTTRRVSLKRTAKGGFTAKELERLRAGEPPLFLYFDSSDKRFMPVRLEVAIALGSFRADLVRECKTHEECKLR